MNAYVSSVIDNVKEKYRNEPEFVQAVEEVLTSIAPMVDKHPEYEKVDLINRMVVPERMFTFRVVWMDDNGNYHTNTGYRCQFNGAIGPYKGGLRFQPNVYPGIIKFLAFEQIFKNSLTGMPIGGGKGGSDFNPAGKSDAEIMRFCQSFMTALYRYIGPDIDVPAGDMGVGGREIGYLYGQYRRLKGLWENGVLTGKGLAFGGSLIRTQATGYGLLYFVNAMLKKNGLSMQGKTVVVSGSGNVAIYAAEKAFELGGKVVAMSDSTGWVYDADGIDLNAIKEIKEVKRARLAEYQKYRPNAEYHQGKGVWSVKCDVALPCATQNELNEEDAKTLIANGVVLVAEGANMPATMEATKLFLEKGVLFAPGKASNAGGVGVSALEMSQNSERLMWTAQEVDDRLRTMMENIHRAAVEAAEEYGLGYNLVAGANLAGFKKVAEAMMAQGAF